MSRPSTVGATQPNGSFKSIYINRGGGPQDFGRTLRDHYTGITKVEELLSLGDLVALGRSIGVKHQIDMNDGEMCFAYERDKGAGYEEAIVSYYLEDWLMNYASSDFAYLFDDGHWKTFMRILVGKTLRYPNGVSWWEDETGNRVSTPFELYLD